MRILLHTLQWVSLVLLLTIRYLILSRGGYDQGPRVEIYQRGWYSEDQDGDKARRTIDLAALECMMVGSSPDDVKILIYL